MFGNITYSIILYNPSDFVANFGDFAKIFVNLSMTQHWPDSAESFFLGQRSIQCCTGAVLSQGRMQISLQIS